MVRGGLPAGRVYLPLYGMFSIPHNPYALGTGAYRRVGMGKFCFFKIPLHLVSRWHLAIRNIFIVSWNRHRARLYVCKIDRIRCSNSFRFIHY